MKKYVKAASTATSAEVQRVVDYINSDNFDIVTYVEIVNDDPAYSDYFGDDFRNVVVEKAQIGLTELDEDDIGDRPFDEDAVYSDKVEDILWNMTEGYGEF